MDHKEPDTNYSINLEVKYDHLQVVDVPGIVLSNRENWFNQTLTKVNDSVVRLGIVKGEFHWHKHDDDDEFYFVLSGRLFIDLETATIRLEKEQGVTISKGVIHRPRAPKKVVLLMVETSAIKPTGEEDEWMKQFKQQKICTYPAGISLNTSVWQLRKIEGISVRGVNVCAEGGMKTLADVLEHYKAGKPFNLIRSCGAKTDNEITDLCEKYKDYAFPGQ
ncbi:MAG: cupin domain-containing protein [Bacteroidetes bacterium]|nr:cupin domain-containing protein [Bacteroidota bacterium]